MDDRFGEWEGGQDLLERLPGHAALLASFAECLSPKPDDAVFESAKRPVVEDDPVVLTMSSQYLRACLTTQYSERHGHRHAGPGGNWRVRRRPQRFSRAVRGCGSGAGSGWLSCRK